MPSPNNNLGLPLDPYALGGKCVGCRGESWR